MGAIRWRCHTSRLRCCIMSIPPVTPLYPEGNTTTAAQSGSAAVPGAGTSVAGGAPALPPANQNGGGVPDAGRSAAAPPPTWGSWEGVTEYVHAQHQNLQEMVKVADAKAAALITLQAIGLALGGKDLVGAVAEALRDWHDVQRDGLLVVGTVLLLLSTMASAAFSIFTLWPRFPKHIVEPVGAEGLMWITPLLHYGEAPAGLPKEVRAALTPTGYLEKLLTMGPQARIADVAFENLKIAWILQWKFKGVARAIKALAVALACLLLTLVGWVLVAMHHLPQSP